MASIFFSPDFGVDAPELSSAPDAPAADRRRLYPKSDGWYDIDDADTEVRLVDTTHNHQTDGVRTKVSTADVSNPPTDAELDAAFGTPATVGSGFVALVDDNDAGTAMYLVASDGTNWWHAALTKAV